VTVLENGKPVALDIMRPGVSAFKTKPDGDYVVE
jgi:hypothetical protein